MVSLGRAFPVSQVIKDSCNTPSLVGSLARDGRGSGVVFPAHFLLFVPLLDTYNS